MTTITVALKKVKNLSRRLERTRERLIQSASIVFDTEPSTDEIAEHEASIASTRQQLIDLTLERSKLLLQLQATNNATVVTYRGKPTTLAALLIERKETLPNLSKNISVLRRRTKSSLDPKESTVVTFFNPEARDKSLEDIDYQYDELDALIDTTNATTELVE